MTSTLECVRAWWEDTKLLAYNHSTNLGSLRTLTLRHGKAFDDRMVILTVSGNPEYALSKSELAAFVSRLLEKILPEAPGELSIILRIHQIAKGHPTQFFEMKLFGHDFYREEVTLKIGSFFKKLEFHISPQAFFQPNTQQASILYSKALELANIHSESVIYDLYCGIGVFGILASYLCKEVIAIELSADGAYDAKTNATRLGSSNFTIYEGDVGKVLEKEKGRIPKPDCIILDPPRSGLDPRAIKEVVDLQAPTIVYVSCNPKTQAENVKEFATFGYTIKAVQPIDQFPHTIHVENIVILNKIFA